MMNSSKPLERFLQIQRFKRVVHFLKGDVLDFGGNKGELGAYVKGDYVCLNYDYSDMNDKSFDTIVALAVIEHLQKDEVTKVFKRFKTCLRPHGQILLTTPSGRAKFLLEFLALIGALDKKNIAEHKYYWSKKDLCMLADQTGFIITKYQKFEMGFNQYVIFSHPVPINSGLQ